MGGPKPVSAAQVALTAQQDIAGTSNDDVSRDFARSNAVEQFITERYMIAVDFSPRNPRDSGRRRGATLDDLADLRASSVAPRRDSLRLLNRGLKSRATFTGSLRDKLSTTALQNRSPTFRRRGPELLCVALNCKA